VDFGAGPDGVDTLLTWKADQEYAPSGAKMVPGAAGKKGKGKIGPDGQSQQGEEEEEVGKPQTPEKVFVTGTFAKGWNAKIELRRKECVASSAQYTNLHFIDNALVFPRTAKTTQRLARTSQR
jgi:hypothetical protein